MVAAHQAGMTVKDLAAALGVHRTTISEHLQQRGLNGRKGGLDEDDVQEAARLYEEGWSSARLGKKFAVSPNTVLAKLRRAGVRIRPRRGGPDSAGTAA